MAKLGRVPSPPDSRDAEYPIRRVLAPRPLGELPRYKYWARGPILDQDNVGACVGFSHAQWLQSYPVRTLRIVTDSASFVPNTALIFRAGESVAESRLGFYIYGECKEIDGYDGEGTYVRSAMDVLRRLGRIDTYVWAQNMEELVNWLLLKGPVILGTDWTEDMFDPDERGYLHPVGPVMGGHAYMLRGANRVYVNPDKTVGRVRVVNSWSEGWGQNGCAWLSFTDLEALVFQAEYGEAITAVERAT